MSSWPTSAEMPHNYQFEWWVKVAYFSDPDWMTTLQEDISFLVYKEGRRTGFYGLSCNALRRMKKHIEVKNVQWNEDRALLWSTELDLNQKLSHIRCWQGRTKQLKTDQSKLVLFRNLLKKRLVAKIQTCQEVFDNDSWNYRDRIFVQSEMEFMITYSNTGPEDDWKRALKEYAERALARQAQKKILEEKLEKWKKRMEDFNDEFGVKIDKTAHILMSVDGVVDDVVDIWEAEVIQEAEKAEKAEKAEEENDGHMEIT